MQERILVTGGAGFIGSHIAKRFINIGHKVAVIDNLSSGTNLMKGMFTEDRFEFIQKDLNSDSLSSIGNFNEIWHMAADPDVRRSSENPKKHFEQNILSTINLIEMMRKNDINTIYFASTSAVYGEAKSMPTSEDYSPMEPTSIYGASKLACESLLSSYHNTYGLNTIILRLGNIIGPDSSHGIISDFIRKLKDNNKSLEILGDGNQSKSYLHIDDCIEAFMFLRTKVSGFGVYNISSVDQIKVTRIAEIISEYLGLSPEFVYTGGKKGWKGDIPEFLLSTEKIKSLGWSPKYKSEDAIKAVVKESVK